MKESLLSIQLDQLAQMTASRLQPFQELAEKIAGELNDYRGERLGEFQEKLLLLWSRAGLQERPVRALLMRNRGRNTASPADARMARNGGNNRPGGTNQAGGQRQQANRGEQAAGNQQRQQNVFYRREQSPGGAGNGNPAGNQQRQQLPSFNRGEQASGNRREQPSLDRGEQASGGGGRRAL